MEWGRRVWYSEKAQKDRNRIMTAVEQQEAVPGVYLVTLPVTDDGQLEVYPSWMPAQRFELYRSMTVVGVAAGYDDAKELVRRMVEDLVKETGDASHLAEALR